MDAGSAPTPPDPAKTAAAQTGTNLATAQANAVMNNINQVTPYGNLTYSQSGKNFISDPNGQNYWVDPQGVYHDSQPTRSVTTQGTPGTSGMARYDKNGNVINDGSSHPGTAGGTSNQGYTPDGWTSVKGEYVPSYTATQTLSPQQQSILDQTQAAQLNLGTLANQQSAKMVDYLNQPVDLSSANIDKYSNDHYLPGFNTQWDHDQSSLDQKLADQGIKLGSAAYQNAQQGFTTQKTSANDQFLGDMYNNAQQSILTARNQPINEISALLGGSQVTQPTYAGFNQSQSPTVDYAGLVSQNFADQEQNYQQKVSQANAVTGGLFGLAGAGLGGWAKSDRRLKTDITKIGELNNGLAIYSYHFKTGGPVHVGLMSDEVRLVHPDAVYRHVDGYDRVNYEMAVV